MGMKLYNEQHMQDIADSIRDRIGYTGKNLLVTSLEIIKSKNTSGTWNENIYTYNGVTYTINDDLSITIGGVFSSRSYMYMTHGFNCSPDKYILNGIKDDVESTSRLDITISDGEVYKLDKISQKGDTTIDLSIYENPKVSAYIDVRDANILNKTIYPMLRLASIENDTYEPHDLKYKLSEIAAAIKDLPSVEEVNVYKQYIPKETVTDGVCENAVALNAKKVEVDGNSKQETTSGKNILPNDFSKYTIEGNYLIYQLPINEGDLVKMSFVDKDTTIDISDIYIGFKNNIGVVATSYHWCITNGSVKNDTTNTPTIGDEFCGTIFIYPKTEEAFDRLFKRYDIQVELGSEATSYEPYTNGASPNPDYPQEIEVVDGCNLFDNTRPGIYLNNSKIFVDYERSSTTSRIVAKENDVFTLSSSNHSNGLVIASFDKNNNCLLRSAIGGTTIIHTCPQNTNYIIASNYQYSDDNMFTMLIKGDEQKSYLPYGHIGLRQSGKNLAKETFDAKLAVSGSGQKRTVVAKSDFQGQIIKVKPNTSYYINGDFSTLGDSSMRIAMFDSMPIAGSVSTKYITGSTGFNFTTDINTKYLLLFNTFDRQTVVENLLLQLTSITDTSYEPYKENIYSIDLAGNTIAKVGNVKDILNISEKGNVSLTKKIRKVVLNGNEEWSNQTYGMNALSTYSILKTSIDNHITRNFIDMISNNFIAKTDATAANIGDFGVGTNYINFYKDNDKNVDSFKIWLSTHNVEVYYQLAEPQTISLPTTEPIKLWDGYNKFELITNLDTDFSMEYYKDYNSLITEIQTALLNAEPEI